LIATVVETVSDQVLNLLPLSEAGRAAILQVLDRPPSPETSVRLAELFRSAVMALGGGDAPKMLTHLTAFATLDPRRAETLESEPALAPARGDVKQLMAKLTVAAKAEAETQLEQARQAPQAAESELILLVAERLIEAGGYANSVHSTELSHVALDNRQWAPINVPAPWPEPLRLSSWRSVSGLSPRRLLWIVIALAALVLIALLFASC
jgi:hypothetical protein